MRHDQISCWVKEHIIDKKSFYWLNVWSIGMWRDLVLFLFLFCLFTCTVRLLLHSLLERVGVSFKIGSSRSKEGGNILDVDEQMVRGGGGGSWKLHNFHGRHMYLPLKNPAIWLAKNILGNNSWKKDFARHEV